MAISENRIQVEKIIESNKNNEDISSTSSSSTSSSGDMSKATDKQPKGLISNLPSSLQQFSSYKELMDYATNKVNDTKNTINQKLKIPTVDDLIKMTSKTTNKNMLVVNKSLGLFKAAFCEGSTGDLGLIRLLNALNYRFDFIREYNVCGRQRVRNPLDVLLKYENEVVTFYNGIINLDKRLVANFLSASERFVSTNKLPIDLKNCTSYNALKAFSQDFRNGMTSGVTAELKKFFSNKICSKSDTGIITNSNIVKKYAATPYVGGLASYDKNNMYAGISTVVDKGYVTKDIVLDILQNTLEENSTKNNMINTLELIAYTKVVAPNKETTTNNSVSISNTATNLQNNSNSADKILENVINAYKNETPMKTDDALNIGNTDTTETNAMVLGKFTAKDLICNMEDEKESTDVVKDFNNLMTLLEIADNKFKPEESIDVLSISKTITDLATSGSQSRYQASSNTTVNINNIEYHSVNDDLDVMDYVNILSNSEVTDDILVCKCSCK